MRRLFDKVVTFRTGEATTAWLMFAYSFLAMSAYNILKPITRSKFISDLGADNLPWVQLGGALIISVLMQFYSRLIVRVPRRAMIPVTLAGLVALLLTFWMLFRTDATWVSVAFYVFCQMLGILLISQFWTLANNLYDSRQARRLFGFIGGGSSLGAALGAGLTVLIVDELGTDNLLLVSAVTLAACGLIVYTVVRKQSVTDSLVLDDERGVGGGEAIRMLRESRHLQVIALVIAFASIGAGIIEQQLNMVGATKGSENAITRFLGQITFYVSIAGFFIQIGLTSRIHRSLGLAVALLLLPVGLGATGVAILFTGAVWMPGVARVLDSSLRYTIDKTTREVLFLPLPADMKYRAKPFVDVTMDRLARGFGAVLLLVLIKPWGLRLTWIQLSYASLAVMGLWIAGALYARREYLRTFRKSIGAREVEPSAIRIDVADPATLDALVEQLSSPDESAVIYAMDMLGALGHTQRIPPLLLHHDSARVRAQALNALASTPPEAAATWTPAVERLVDDEDVDVRAAAVRALAAIRHDDRAFLHDFLADVNHPRVVVTAAVALADTGQPDDARAADAALVARIEDTRAVSAGTRRDIAAGLARIKNPAFRHLLIPLIHDPNIDVAREAVRSAKRMGGADALFVPALVSLLGHRVLKADARDALESYGHDIVELLAHVLLDREEHAWVRRHVPATLARLPVSRSVQALVTSLDDPDGFLRYKVIEALETMRREHPALVNAPAPAEALILTECTRYCRFLTLRSQLGDQAADGARSLLSRALDDKLARSLDRIFRLLGLVHPWKDIADARYSIERGDPRSRAAGLEYLDGLLGSTIRKRLMPLLDESPLTDKLRYAHHVLRTRPRDLNDTVAQLLHEDDPVVSASAAWFVAERRLWTLQDDLQFVIKHAAAQNRMTVEAATFALGAHRESGTPAGARTDTTLLPVVGVVDRLRRIPLFDAISIDELFRIANAGQQVHFEPERHIGVAGNAVDAALFLLDGTVTDGAHSPVISAPAAIHFEEILEGGAARSTLTAAAPAVCLRLESAAVMTMIADNVALAQGLFEMLLASHTVNGSHEQPARGRANGLPDDRAIEPLDLAYRLRQSPWLSRATGQQLVDIVEIAREAPLQPGQVLFSARERPACYHVLSGTVQIDREGASPIVLQAGATIGVPETLAGVSHHAATVVTGGRALRIDREDLFEVLVNHVDLLQGVFSGVLHESRRSAN